MLVFLLSMLSIAMYWLLTGAPEDASDGDKAVIFILFGICVLSSLATLRKLYLRWKAVAQQRTLTFALPQSEEDADGSGDDAREATAPLRDVVVHDHSAGPADGSNSASGAGSSEEEGLESSGAPNFQPRSDRAGRRHDEYTRLDRSARGRASGVRPLLRTMPMEV